MGFIGTFILGMLAGDVVWWVQAHRWLGPVRHARRWQLALAAFLLAQMLGLALVLASRERQFAFAVAPPQPLLAAIFIWHLLILFPALVCVAAWNLSTGAIWLAKRISRTAAAKPASPPERLSRREFLGVAFAIAPAVLTLGSTAASLPQLTHFRLRRLDVPLADLPPALDGLTIAHVSDIHVGRFTQGRVLAEVVRATNALRADLVLMTGDLINYDLRDLPTALDLVRQLRGENGVFTCIGNHDLIESSSEFVRQTRAGGVNLLVNETRLIEVRGVPIEILGLRWGAPLKGEAQLAEHGDRAIAASARELLALRQHDAFPILLAHHPHAFDFAEGIPLTLAGHTHGGQLMLSEKTGFGPWLFRYWSGLYERAGRTLVVSNGVGNWFPLRTNAPAEIIHLTLRRAA